MVFTPSASPSAGGSVKAQLFSPSDSSSGSWASGLSKSNAGTYVDDVAAKFGGGGHKFAAGCKVSNSNVLEIEKNIVNLLKEKIG